MGISRRSWVAVTLVVALLLAGWLGWAIADRNSGASHAERVHQTQLGRMLDEGRMQTMLEQHRSMMEQMRVDVSPQMLERMNADPMWELMRSGELTEMMEDQQDQIDQMLGRGG